MFMVSLSVRTVRGLLENPLTDYHLQCPDPCSLKEGTVWGAQATEMLLAGKSLRTIVAAAAAQHVAIQLSTLSRHKKHIVANGPSAEASDTPRATNIEILEAIIAKGYANQKNWKPTIGDTMKAMDFWFKLTQGNPFDDLLDTLASASMGESEVESLVEAPEASGLPDEVLDEDEEPG